MPASEVVYAPGVLDLSALCFDQGSTARRQINGLTNTWNKIGIAFAMRCVGTTTLASAAVDEAFNASTPAACFAFGLKNDTSALIGQNGCKFIGAFSNNVGGYIQSRVTTSINGLAVSGGVGGRFSGGVCVDTAFVENEPATSGGVWFEPSTGTEATTNFTRITALTLEITGRGTAGQQLIIGRFTSAPSATSVINQAALQSAILAVTTTITVSCPYPTWDLNDINCVYIQWPFANNRLLVFGPTSGPAGSPFVMRLA